MSWNDLSEWWLKEIADDRSYEDLVTPLLLEVLNIEPGSVYLDLGCGDGRVMRTVGEHHGRTIGVELSPGLAAHAAKVSPTVIGRLPDLAFLQSDGVDAAYCALALEHIPDLGVFFQSLARVVKPGGIFSLVINHPIWTAPGSTPITDDTDGEVFWRSGDYFGNGYTDERAGNSTIRFHHRSMAGLVNAAADAGWSLEMMVERPHHEIVDQAGIPRLLACRWRLVP